MAITWGGWAMRDAYYGQRVGIDLSRSGNTFTAKYYVETKGSVYYNGLVLDRSGAIDGNVSFNWNTGSASTLLVNTATKTGSPGNSYTFQASVSLPWWGGKCSVSRSGSIPIDKPAAPTSVVATRNSDSKASITWKTSSPSSAPVLAVAVERTDITSGYVTWKRVATLYSNATSYTDTGIAANNRYGYRVRTANSSGDSAWTGSGRFSTTPAPPTNVQAVKNADGSITVSWTRPAPLDFGTNFYVFDNGTQVGTVGRDDSSWTHTDPDTGVTHTYTVKKYESTGDLLSVASSPSNTVQLLAAPSAPTSLSPNGSVVAVENGLFDLAWVHNPVDSSAQTSAEYRLRVQGGSSWSTGTVATDQSVEVDPAMFAVGSTYEWQVRTRGAYMPSDEAGYSPWSAVATVRLANVPGVSISTPDTGTVAVSSLTVAWTYYQAQSSAQASSQVQLLDGDGTVVEDRTVSGAATSRSLTTRLADAATYKLRVRARSGDGLWSPWDEVAFSVAYPSPTTPEVTATWDGERGSAQVGVFNPEPLDSSLTRTNLVQNPRGKYTGVTVEVRRNLIFDPGCENPTLQYLAYGGATVIRDTSTTRNGASSLKVTGGGGTISGVGPKTSPATIDIVPGATITASAYVYNPSGLSLCISAQERTPAGVFVKDNWGPSTTASGWTRISMTATPVDSANHIHPIVYARQVTTDTFWVDDWLVEVGTTVGIGFDGWYSPDSDLTPSWTGTETASASVLSGNRPYYSLEMDPYGCAWSSAIGGQSIANTTVNPSGVSGRWFKNLVGGAGKWVAGAMDVYSPGGYDKIYMNEFGLLQYRSSPYTKLPSMGITSMLNSLYMNEVSSDFVHLYGSVQLPDTVPDDMPIGFYLPRSINSSDVVYVKNVMLAIADTEAEALASVQTYFDGDMGPTLQMEGQSYDVEWTGTPGSSSTLATPNSPATVENTLERSVDGGATWETVAEGLDPNTTITDPECLSAGTTLYRATAISALPSSSVGEGQLEVTKGLSTYLSGEDGFTTVARLTFKTDQTITPSVVDRQLVYFSGRTRPVALEGEATGLTINASALLLPDRAAAEGQGRTVLASTLRALAQKPGRILYRDATGRRVYGRITSLQIAETVDGIGQLQYTITESEEL